jgi:hypothetical protein
MVYKNTFVKNDGIEQQNTLKLLPIVVST